MTRAPSIGAERSYVSVRTGRSDVSPAARKLPAASQEG